MKKNLTQSLRELAVRLKERPALVEFDEQTIVIAKNQPQYLPLPAYKYREDHEGKTVFCWKLSWRDRLRVLLGWPIWHTVLTFNAPLQPQKISTDKPFMPTIWPRPVQCNGCNRVTLKVGCQCGHTVPISEVCDIYHIGKCPACHQFVDEQCPAKK
jgi:hypothetical protein